MEVAGLAIGGVSLLLELFDQSVTAYKLFVEGKELEKTSTHLTARLNIEERRLVQWGEGSGFAGEGKDAQKKVLGELGVDSRLLKNKALSDVISRTLICIKDVLFDADALSAKYGLKVFKQSPGDEIKNKGREQKTDPGILKKQTLEKESLRISKGVHSKLARFKWAVKDKEGFQKLMEQLRYYNDSLYSLLPIEVGLTITRDVLASLLVSASDQSLLQFRALGKKTQRGNGEAKGSYDDIGSAATVALMVRYQTTEAVPILPDDEIHLDSDSSALAIWKNASATDVRILLEKKIGARSQGYKKGTQHYDDLRVLATMLSKSSVAETFRTLRCLGLTEKYADHATIFPTDADPMAEPITLYDLLQEDDKAPYIATLDQRFELAKSLASAVHQMHSAGWMHKDISSHNVIFFKHKGANSKTPYDLARPYLKGFRFARRVSAAAPQPEPSRGSFFSRAPTTGREGHMQSHAFRPRPTSRYDEVVSKAKEAHANFELLQECLYQHPSYLFHRLISEADSDHNSEIAAYKANNKRETYYKCRHEYFSLGLILLEIGLWRTLDAMNVLREPFAPSSIWNIPVSLSLTYAYGTWDVRALKGRMDTAMRIMRVSRMQYLNEDLSSTDSDGEEWPEELEDYITSLQRALREENIVGIPLKTRNAARDIGRETFWSLWDEVYPHACLRKDAIRLAQSLLGVPMGTKFRGVVMRCLSGDFSIDQKADESTWLRAFNWTIVKELENCSA
jgi:hypothetical protein